MNHFTLKNGLRYFEMFKIIIAILNVLFIRPEYQNIGVTIAIISILSSLSIASSILLTESNNFSLNTFFIFTIILISFATGGRFPFARPSDYLLLGLFSILVSFVTIKLLRYVK